ncbi:TetR/AcrR family transcriptional regulator [Streptomyces sp. WAC07149]|nr:TetR/AcrR family transcriptional regulator [Streptomyces sp. WAC07149]
MKEEAVRRLAGRQAVDLDPRAVARHAGVERATADRLFPDRTALLTALVLDAYNSMGESAERAAAAAEGTGADLLERWVAVWQGVRAWALAHPEEYVLIWGRPVPGYSAPPETMAAGARTVLTLVGLLREGVAADVLTVEHPGEPPLSDGMTRNAEVLAAGLLAGIPLPAVARMLVVWTQLHGMVGFEVNGHVAGVAADPDAFFTHAAAVMGEFAGLPR